MPGDVDSDRAADRMEQYNEYLNANYKGGSEKFFSPTGFLDVFQKTVQVKSQSVRNHVSVRSIDEAHATLEPVVAGGEGVFDLTAEPGTGKTSVLPFKFPSKKVIVALPTPFDAWGAFNMATGRCQLKLKGLRLGSEASVVYTDSYLAAKALLCDFLDYDVMIVDECDSDRGVSRFLSEVKTKGKVLIRMSASHGTTSGGPSSTFRVNDVDSMPDVRQSVGATAEFIQEKHVKRSLVLAPDSDTAAELHGKLPGSVLVTSKTPLGQLARVYLDQKGRSLYVSDDNCGRGLNLNVDALFDCQLVAEYGAVRIITPVELYQRKGRVGRNKEGWYYSPGLKPVNKVSNDIDVVRNNVVRCIAEVPQVGDERLQFTDGEADDFMCSDREPYYAKMVARAENHAVISSSSGSRPNSREISSPSEYRSCGSDGDETVSVKAPPWLCYFSGYSGRMADKANTKVVDSFVVSKGRRGKHFGRKSSSSGSDVESVRSVSRSYMASERSSVSRDVVASDHRLRPSLPVAQSAPYAVDRRDRSLRSVPRPNVPMSPPIMDLNDVPYDMDWPHLVRDRLVSGGDLPTIVPMGDWRHTSSGGMGTDWFRRLEDIASRDFAFDDTEFEVMVRAWNKLVAQTWVRRTPGLSSASDAHRLEFCLRYFQAYFMQGSAQ